MFTIKAIKDFLGFTEEEKREIDELSDVSSVTSSSDISDLQSDIQDVDKLDELDIMFDNQSNPVQIEIDTQPQEDIYTSPPAYKYKPKTPSPPPTPLPKVESNLVFMNFDKRILTKPEIGKWDFLTLYKTLLHILHTNKIPTEINGINLSHYQLNINETKNYKHEMLEMEKFFTKRYNILKTMKSKIISLKFLKNGEYIKAEKILRKLQSKLENKEYVEEMVFLMNQPSHTSEEKKQITYFQNLVKKEKEYKDLIIGTNLEKIKLKQRKIVKKEEMFKKITKINKDLEKISTQTNSEKYRKIFDSKYKLKQIILKREEEEEEEEDTSKYYLRSKMIYHLKNFFDINNLQAISLLENNLFDTLIKIDVDEINEKLNMINDELFSYEDIKTFLYQTKNKTFVCPYCTYSHNIQINIHFHTMDVHNDKPKTPKPIPKPKMKNKFDFDSEGSDSEDLFGSDSESEEEEEEKLPESIIPKDNNLYDPILIIEPIRNNGVFESIYDGFKSTSKNEVIHHIKQLHITPDTKRGERVLNKMIVNNAKDGKMKVIKDRSEIKISSIQEVMKKDFTLKLKINEKEHERKLREYVERLDPMVFFKRKGFEEEYNKIQEFTNKIINEAKGFHNISLAYKWVKSSISNYYLTKQLNKLNKGVKITISFDGINSQVIDFENIDNVINKKLPVFLQINDDKPMIEDSELIDYPGIEISRDRLLREIKQKIFMKKVEKFGEKLARKVAVNISGDSMTKIQEIRNVIPKIFKKVINQQSKKLLLDKNKRIRQHTRKDFDLMKDTYINFIERFDEFVEKINTIKDSNVMDYLLNIISLGKKENMQEIDEYLYYVLMSFLPNDNPAVKHTYKVLENPSEEEEEFRYKYKVWEWQRKYKLQNEDDPKNYKMIANDKIIDSLFPGNKENTLEMEITNHKIQGEKRVYELVNFDDYVNDDDDVNRANIVIEDFLMQCFKQELFSKENYKLYLSLMFLKKLTKALKISEDNTLNAEMIYRYLRVLDLYLEKPLELNVRKIGMPIKNRMVVNTGKKEEEKDENKEDLLNDFMELTEEQMKINLQENLLNNSKTEVENEEDDFNDFDIQDNDEIINVDYNAEDDGADDGIEVDYNEEYMSFNE